MQKFIISWNAGYGEDSEIIYADSLEEAEQMAYEEWRQEAETQADYSAKPYSKEEAEDLGLE